MTSLDQGIVDAMLRVIHIIKRPEKEFCLYVPALPHMKKYFSERPRSKDIDQFDKDCRRFCYDNPDWDRYC